MALSPQQRRGTQGRPVRASVNAFAMRWSGAKSVYHYDVMSPLWQVHNDYKGIGSAKGTEIMMRLQNELEPELFGQNGAYDGKKNLFSFKDLQFHQREFQVQWSPGKPRPNAKIVSVKLAYVTQVDFDKLQRLLRGSKVDASIVLTMLNVFVQASPKMVSDRLYNQKSFFIPDRPKLIENSPLQLWRGFFQSARPSFDRIIVNVDVTVGVVIPRTRFEAFCGEFIKARDARRLYTCSGQDFQRLRAFARSVKFELDPAIYKRGEKQRPKTVHDLIKDCGNYHFEKDGQSVTVYQHYKEAYAIDIQPHEFGVKTKNGSVFPMSRCIVTLQLYKPRASPEIVSAALAFTPPNPSARAQTIHAMWSSLNYENSPFLIGAGINIDAERIKINGRILPPPKICFGEKHAIDTRRGTWDVMRKTFVAGAVIHGWVVVDFARVAPPVMDRFLDELRGVMAERGLVGTNRGAIPRHHHIARLDGNVDIARMEREIQVHDARINLLVVFLPSPAIDIYQKVKRFGDITKGIRTQCIEWKVKLDRDAKNGKLNQYHNNLILKINTKLGGVNFFPQHPILNELVSEPTMIIGADVSHPGPGSHMPSVTGVVTSWDKRFCQYVGMTKVQESRTEVIKDFGSMVEAGLQCFIHRNADRDQAKNIVREHKPSRLIYFRDGVSEGEFETVKREELAALQGAIQRVYKLAPGDKLPKLIFIIVGKRHHFRFFPESQEATDQSGNGNLFAGFVADQDIVHPLYHDFYLQSQPGLKGTSRPSHYTVLENTAGFTPDMLQALAYALCHCYSRSTRSVKIPAPVYYADLVCRRAKFHFNGSVTFSDTASVSSDDHAHIDFYRSNFEPIHQSLRGDMYFV